MDLQSRSPNNPSTASPSSTTNHSIQTNKRISTSCILKKPTSSVTAKRPVSKEKPTPSTTTTEKQKDINVENSGSVSEKDHRRVWTVGDEILLLKGMAGRAKSGENPNSIVFLESMRPSFSLNYSLEQIKSKIRHAKDRYIKNEKEEEEGNVLSFPKDYFKECYEWSKMIWGSGGEPKDGGGSGETVVMEDDVQIRKNKKDEKRKDESTKQGKNDGNAASATEEQEGNNVEEHAVAANQKGGEAGENKERIKKKKRKDDSTKQGENDGNAASATEEQEEGETGKNTEKNKKKKKKKKRKHGAGAGERVSEKVKASTDNQKEGEAGKNKEKNKKKKRKHGAGDGERVSEKVKASTDNQKEEKHGEKERNKKKKKKRKVDSVSENLIGQLSKAPLGLGPLGLGSFLDEEALQLIEPSKSMALQQKWKESRIKEMELFLERSELAREGALLVLEALKAAPPS